MKIHQEILQGESEFLMFYEH